MTSSIRPTGTVTFLFSDIEQSTRLVERLGSRAFAKVLEQHQRILRTAFVEHDGVERGTEGDSFFVVFAQASAAVAAAADGQVRLAEAQWPDDGRIQVRMGMHTGVGILGGDDYVGIDVHLAARIAAAAHGGQILLSDATRALVARKPLDRVQLRALGSYRLKDIAEPERLWQLDVTGLRTEFPPLRALDVRRAHLPPDATTFVGREAELESVARLVAERRLVTLTGPGGTGKTRLALRAGARAAEAFANGAFFVPLATVTDATLVPRAIASSLDLPDDSGSAMTDVLADWTREREVLLVLDNLEQIETVGSVVGRLLHGSPGVRVLATSRSRLDLAGEQEFAVAPFATPGTGAARPEIEASEAVRLFVDRAHLVRPDLAFGPDELAIVGEVTRQVDGLPLAIELAAARLRMLPLPAIRDRLERRLEALVGGPADAPARQRSLREAIAWSHDLLDAPARVLFRRLAVFAGGWDIEAAEGVAAVDGVSDVELGLSALVDQSLVQPRSFASRAWFTMLPTIAEFAAEQLDASGERLAVERAHAAYVRRLAESVAAHADGPDADAWFDRVEADLDNVRTVIRRSTRSGDLDEALGVASALRPFWLRRNHAGEGLNVLVALSDAAVDPNSREFAAATAAAAAIADWLGDYAAARRTGARSAEAFRLLGDQAGYADAIGSLAFATIEVDPQAALALNAESHAAYRAIGDVRGEGQALLGRATALFALGRPAETRETLEQSLDLLRGSGDQYFALFCGVFLARIKLLTGDPAAGMADLRGVLEASRRMGLRLGIAIALDYIAEVAIWNDDVGRAVRLGAAAARLKEELGGGVPPRMGGGIEPLEAARVRLPPAQFSVEVAAGRGMDIDSVVASGLEVAPPRAIPKPAAG